MTDLGPTSGLHHETDTRPNRARTVLVYIHAPREKRDSSRKGGHDSSRKGGHDSSAGGRTIFPLCGPVVSPQSRQGKLITTFGDALQSQWGDDAATGCVCRGRPACMTHQRMTREWLVNARHIPLGGGCSPQWGDDAATGCACQG